MTERKLIEPTSDAPVPKQSGETLDPAGEILPVTSWWRRREADGAVTIKDAPRKPGKKHRSKEA